MNNTYGDLKTEYEKLREATKRFGTWNELDVYVEKLITSLSPKIEKALKQVTRFSFDDMGTPVPFESEPNE